MQFVGFLISRLVDYEWPTLGLMTFLILFIGAFGIAWPIAVRIAESLSGAPAGWSRRAERRLRRAQAPSRRGVTQSLRVPYQHMIRAWYA